MLSIHPSTFSFHVFPHLGEEIMAANFTGGCMCGAVRYVCSAEPLVSGNCHCRDCQRATGSAFAPAILVVTNALNITGDVQYFETMGGSGHVVSRGFCPNCGSRLFGKSGANPDLISILAGSLDDPSWFRPIADIYTSSAQPWDHMDPAIPKYPKMPT
jgi:hypothetical protein